MKKELDNNRPDLQILCKKEEALQKKKIKERSSSPHLLSSDSFSIYRPPKGEGFQFAFGNQAEVQERDFIIRNRSGMSRSVITMPKKKKSSHFLLVT